MKKVLLSLIAVAAISLGSFAETVTLDFTDASKFTIDGTFVEASGNQYDKYQPLNSITSAEGFVFSFTKISGSNAPGYFSSKSSGWTVRVYNNCSFTLTAPEGTEMTSVAFTGSNATPSYTVETGTWVANNNNATWTGKANVFTVPTTNSWRITKVEITYEANDPSDTREPAGLAWSETSVSVLTTEVADFTAPTLTNPNDVAVTYASDNTAVATVTEAGVVALTGTKGDAKITATFAGNDSYKPQEVSYTITVKAPLPVNTSSLENPYTVAEALAIIADLDGTTMNDVYVKGTVDANPEFSAQYGNMTYQIFDAPKSESAKTLTIFRGKYFDGEAFNAENQLKEGDEVIVKGNILNYGGTTPEMDANNVVVSLNGSTTPPAVEATEVNNVLATTALASGTPVKVNYALTVGYASGSNIFACDEDGDFIQLYGTNTLKAGDIIPAGWEGTYTLYGDNTPEITFTEDALPVATESTFTPKEVEATAITDALVNHVVTVKNVNFEEATPATKTDFTGTVGETTLNLFNQYELASVDAGKYDVTGVVAIRNLNGSPVAKLFVTNITKSETDSALLIGAGDNTAPVEYYNLQGVRVDNPANGIFIRRQGSKAQKIVL